MARMRSPRLLNVNVRFDYERRVMKRTTSRRQMLPAFRLTVGQAEILERELRSLFQGEVGSHFSITLDADEYRFDTADEIRGAAATLPAVVHDFSLWVSAWPADDRYVSLSASGRPSVSVQASDYGWCAAVVATCEKATRQYKRWYSSLRAWHFWVLATAAGLLPGALATFFKAKVVVGLMGTLAWLLLAALLWVIFFAFNRVFPPASLVIREQESWVKRHTPELTLVLSLAALVVAVLTFVLK